jgi:hypothetical protein
MELCHKVGCMDVVSWLPSVMCFGISFPLDPILDLLVTPKVPHAHHTFHFPLLFSIDKVRRGFGEVAAMFRGFLIWG